MKVPPMTPELPAVLIHGERWAPRLVQWHQFGTETIPLTEKRLTMLLAELSPEQRARLLHACHPLIGSVYDLLDKSQKKAEQYERDWYDAKAEFGTARATDARRIESLEKALEESRRMLEEERGKREAAEHELAAIRVTSDEQLKAEGCDLDHALAAVRLLRTMNTAPSADVSIHALRSWYLRDVDLGNAHRYPPRTEARKA